MSLAEEFYACSVMETLRGEDGNKFFNLHDCPGCVNHLFNKCYLTYHQNLSGQLRANDAFGIIPQHQVDQDVAFLETQYREWLQVIETTNHSDLLLQYVGKESRNHLKNSRKFALRRRQGSRLQQHAEKSVVLHSKYLYLKVRKFYQELKATEQLVTACGHTILIDGFAHFHILFRHYAQHVKEYQDDTSYHVDQNLNPENLPNELVAILQEYFHLIPCASFNRERTYVRINGTVYAIWFKAHQRHSGGQTNQVLRLQTFYPVTQARELEFVGALAEMVAPSGRGLFYKPIVQGAVTDP
ncbi:hypothetical protein KYK14_01435 [Hymenobacter profundi]|uniref:Uncharacterized protein n=1 Tax=Hymenobacter profundi TaxID=1982110 RepID=A0ABS6WUE5_9BACT|nr:hypothetical protein [Hymenobacter profundi]